jgi:hypothetical protein
MIDFENHARVQAERYALSIGFNFMNILRSQAPNPGVVMRAVVSTEDLLPI